MEDKYGFDAERTTLLVDNDFFDATECAHPAWFRGQEHATRRTADLLCGIANNGAEKISFGCLELDMAAHAICALRDKVQTWRHIARFLALCLLTLLVLGSITLIGLAIH